jgi:hypothetical protein
VLIDPSKAVEPSQNCARLYLKRVKLANLFKFLYNGATKAPYFVINAKASLSDHHNEQNPDPCPAA